MKGGCRKEEAEDRGDMDKRRGRRVARCVEKYEREEGRDAGDVGVARREGLERGGCT